MANFVSQSQIKTILQRIKAWLTANMAPKSTAVTNVSVSGTKIQKTINGTTTDVYDLSNKADLSNSSQNIITGTLAADSNITAEGYIGASSFSLTKNSKTVTVDSDASADYTIKFPNKANSGSPYTIATTADIPASITIDSSPTSGSNNAVSSGGVYTALAGKAGKNGSSSEDFAAEDITASTVTASTSVSAPTVEATNEVVIGGTTLYDNGGTLSIGLPSRDGTIALLSDIATEPAYEIATRDASTGLPDVSNPKHSVIYLVLTTNGTNNAYDEYLWVNTTGSTNVWEKIGSTEISLTDYWHHKSGQSSSADYLAEANMGNASDTASTADSASIYAWLNSYFPAS